MKTGGPAKTAAALAHVANRMNSEQRELYGGAFDTFSNTLNGMQRPEIQADGWNISRGVLDSLAHAAGCRQDVDLPRFHFAHFLIARL
jgi:hypothetical protein